MESARLTIIVVDGAVYRDQHAFSDLDLQTCNIPSDVHALQWLNGTGHIEFVNNSPNEPISELPSWATKCIELWEQAYILLLEEQQKSLALPVPSEIDPDAV